MCVFACVCVCVCVCIFASASSPFTYIRLLQTLNHPFISACLPPDTHSHNPPRPGRWLCHPCQSSETHTNTHKGTNKGEGTVCFSCLSLSLRGWPQRCPPSIHHTHSLTRLPPTQKIFGWWGGCHGFGYRVRVFATTGGNVENNFGQKAEILCNASILKAAGHFIRHIFHYESLVWFLKNGRKERCDKGFCRSKA